MDNLRIEILNYKLLKKEFIKKQKQLDRIAELLKVKQAYKLSQIKGK